MSTLLSVSWVQDHIWLRATSLDKELGAGQHFGTKLVLEMLYLFSGHKVCFPLSSLVSNCSELEAHRRCYVERFSKASQKEDQTNIQSLL